ncbi:energy transducer TonB [Asaia astilbis]|uniref:energy transducer TonB n=1 Tax=Asaia astilbis TaxID=610244 RepID=UPI000A044BCD
MRRVLILILPLFFTSCASAPKKELRAYYPEDLIKKNETGDVTVSCDIAVDGRPQNCRIVSSTNHHFDAEALRFLDKARYEPAMHDGHPVVEHGHILHVNYRLGD